MRLIHVEAPSFSASFPHSSSISISRVHRLEADTRRAIEAARASGASDAEMAIWAQRAEEARMIRVRVLVRMKVSPSKAEIRKTQSKRIFDF